MWHNEFSKITGNHKGKVHDMSADGHGIGRVAAVATPRKCKKHQENMRTMEGIRRSGDWAQGNGQQCGGGKSPVRESKRMGGEGIAL